MIEAEKEQQQLISGIENFDSTKLKHTITEEKNPLPTKEGKFIKYIIIIYFTSRYSDFNGLKAYGYRLSIMSKSYLFIYLFHSIE